MNVKPKFLFTSWLQSISTNWFGISNSSHNPVRFRSQHQRAWDLICFRNIGAHFFMRFLIFEETYTKNSDLFFLSFVWSVAFFFYLVHNFNSIHLLIAIKSIDSNDIFFRFPNILSKRFAVKWFFPRQI